MARDSVRSLWPPTGRWSRWAGDVRGYWRESAGPVDFAKLLALRLSKGRPGRVMKPTVVEVDLTRLGSKVRMRSHSTDVSVLSEILFSDSLGHLPDMSAARTVIDLGANIGLSYRWLRRRYPTAKFVCVEPHPANVALLRSNIDGNCAVIEACVGGHERSVRLESADGAWGFRMIDGADTVATTPVITMDRLFHELDITHVDVLKCDIEGAEAELFAACRPWIGAVDTMVVECHPEAMSPGTLVQALAANGATFAVTHVQRGAPGYETVVLRRLDDQSKPKERVGEHTRRRPDR